MQHVGASDSVNMRSSFLAETAGSVYAALPEVLPMEVSSGGGLKVSLPSTRPERKLKVIKTTYKHCLGNVQTTRYVNFGILAFPSPSPPCHACVTPSPTPPLTVAPKIP